MISKNKLKIFNQEDDKPSKNLKSKKKSGKKVRMQGFKIYVLKTKRKSVS